jgi:hypothetical protein
MTRSKFSTRDASMSRSTAGSSSLSRRAPRSRFSAIANKVSQAELDALRKPVEAANGGLEKAQAEAKALADKARGLVAEAKEGLPGRARSVPRGLPQGRDRV